MEEQITNAVIVERIGNLKNYIEEKVIDLKRDIGEISDLQKVANGRTNKLEEKNVEDKVYKTKLDMAVRWLSILMGFLFVAIIAPIVVIFIQARFIH